jgi:hypothetical protein
MLLADSGNCVHSRIYDDYDVPIVSVRIFIDKTTTVICKKVYDFQLHLLSQAVMRYKRTNIRFGIRW